MTLQEVKNMYAKQGVIFFNWYGIFYYKNHQCEKVDSIPDGNIIDTIHDYPVGHYHVYDNGYIFGKTIQGDVKLKIKNFKKISSSEKENNSHKNNNSGLQK